LSTLSQNNIVVNYVLNDDQVNKAKTGFDKLTDSEKKAVDETRKLNDQLKKTGQEGQDSGKKTETALLRVTGPIRQNSAALSAFTSQLKVAGEVATTAANKASAGFAGVEAKQKAAAAAANAFRNALGSISPEPIIKVKEESQNAAKELNGFSSIAKSGAGLLAGFFAVGSLVAFKDRLVETTIKFEGYSKAIQFGSGSAENFAKNQQFLNDLINKYGLGLASTTEAYKSFFNASTLAGQSQAETNKQFEAVTKAGTVLKLTTDQMQGAFLALGQMMSKGTVQAEELRGQLGERIPGAFSIMAKALNVNERQLNKMLEQGQVLSRDALPKFAAELEKTFGKDAEKNLNGMVNSQNRFNNSIDQLVLAIGTKLQPFLQGAYDLAAGIATQLAGIGQAAKKETTENIALKKAESDIAKKILDVSIQQGVQIDRRRAASELLIEIDAKIFNQLSKNADFRIAKDELGLKKGLEKLAILEKEEIILTQIAGVEIKNLKAKEPLTDAELKALKAQYDARLGLLALEKQERELRGKLANDPNAELTAELKFLEDKLALQEQFAAKGVKISQTEITITKEQQQIAKKDYEAALMQNYKDTTDNEDAKEKARKAAMDKTLEMTKDYAKFSKDISDKSTQDEIDNIEKTARIRRDAEEARAKYEKKKADEKNDIIQASFDLAVTTTNGLFNLQSQYAANDMERKQKQFDQEIKLADGNQQKIDEINQKRTAAEKEYREKEFRANQAQAVANVIFQTAAIVAKWASNPVTAPLAALTLGVQAAQIGIIMAQPVPEFAEGTKGKAFKGKAIVGEKGTELVTTLSGKQYYTPPTATLAQFDEPVHITPNHLLGLNDKYLSSQYFNASSKTDSSGMQIVTELGEIKRELRSLPVAAISLDEKGFMKKVRTPNRSTTILNNRFKN
jgi:tape measure domain-containing protein